MENIFLSRNWYFSRKLDVLSLPRKFIWIKSVASSIVKLEIVNSAVKLKWRNLKPIPLNAFQSTPDFP